MEKVEVREGKAKIIVPNPRLYLRDDGVYEPAWAPVFYNPRMMFNRDLAILILHYYSKNKYGGGLIVSDPLCGVGVRGVRIALEVGNVEKVYMNDINPTALEYAEENAKINGVEDKVTIECLDANISLRLLKLLREHPHYIDIDPFGSPTPFLDSAISAIKRGGLIGVTATDTATLCGLYRRACKRRYWAETVKVDFEKELGLRVLMGNIAMRAAAQDSYVRFILSYYADHYFRVYFEVGKGARRADETLEMVRHVQITPNQEVKLENECSGNVRIGPLWVGPLIDRNVVEGLLKNVEKLEYLASKNRIFKLLNMLMVEGEMPPFYYRLDKLCSRLRRSMPPIDKFLDKLRDLGYKACKTHFDYRGFKTDAPYPTIIECLKSL